jgi:hypothetical protein
MQRDFNSYRDHCLTTSLAPTLLDAMLKKWADEMSQMLLPNGEKFGANTGSPVSHFQYFQSRGVARKEVILKMQRDFNSYRDHCLTTSLAPTLLDAMLKKWVDEYNERMLLTYWNSSRTP